MFKNYLTYQFAVSFHRSCATLSIDESDPELRVKKDRLLRSAETMIHQFANAVRAPDPKDELKHLCVTLIAVRDCKDSLDEISNGLGSIPREILAEYEVLHQRLEKICLKASDAEGGQFRMLG